LSCLGSNERNLAKPEVRGSGSERMKRETKQFSLRENSGRVSVAICGQNHTCNTLILNPVPPNPTKSRLKNKTVFNLPPLLPLAQVKSSRIRVHSCPSVVKSGVKTKNYQTNPFQTRRFTFFCFKYRMASHASRASVVAYSELFGPFRT
jgi:hypothetical protein